MVIWATIEFLRLYFVFQVLYTKIQLIVLPKRYTMRGSLLFTKALFHVGYGWPPGPLHSGFLSKELGERLEQSLGKIYFTPIRRRPIQKRLKLLHFVQLNCVLYLKNSR